MLLLAGASFGQSAVQINGVDLTVGAEEEEGSGNPAAPYVIFSNLGSRDDLYSTNIPFAIAVVGRQVSQTQEQWDAIRFVPKVDVQATVLEAAIGYVSGTKLVQLGIYSNNDVFDTPATLLPGGQGSTTDIPNLGECCQLTKVILPGGGVTLTAGTTYWLVASTDEVSGLSFNGAWQLSHAAEYAVMSPGFLPWNVAPGQWPAARISGTRAEALGPLKAERSAKVRLEAEAAAKKVQIFSNVSPLFEEPYLPGSGFSIAGNNVFGYREGWFALPFTPRTNVQAKLLSPAIGYSFGTNRLNLGIYSDSDGVPGAPLPGGQGIITDLPPNGQCCEFATLRLPGQGAALTAGAKYWLVASPDDINAPDFLGIWQFSTNNFASKLYPEEGTGWTDFSGFWMAAKISGLSE